MFKNAGGEIDLEKDDYDRKSYSQTILNFLGMNIRSFISCSSAEYIVLYVLMFVG